MPHSLVTALPHNVVMSLVEWTQAQAWAWFNGTPMRIVGTIVGALVLRWLLHRVIRRAVALAMSRGETQERSRTGAVIAHANGWDRERHRQRLATVGTLLRSIVTFVVGLVATLTVMSLLGIPLAPLLASAGVGGLALGFGAQSLVKDFLSGVFMIMEDQYGVGDVVDLGEVVGTVQDVSLRITTLLDGTGVTWHVRNGEILRVGNKSQSWSRAVVDVVVQGWAQSVVDLPIGYDADVEVALSALESVAADFAADPQWATKVLEAPELLGVESLTSGTMTLRMVAKCVAGEEFAIQRALRLRAKNALDEAGVPGPRLSGIPVSDERTA